ncbi:hypothetical protein AK812_SmicGene2002 [Symbiodinium microadriaticum]|uniref:Uncharacterized protein n=1 Tax=Symbiodinium microadriaticum TaxID=2951 RepID=A0A1Q9F2V0_SYMMI|nr:hypothetical protein AK812_SmicGene2002 [Symbiodinium microadriaticum]
MRSLSILDFGQEAYTGKWIEEAQLSTVRAVRLFLSEVPTAKVDTLIRASKLAQEARRNAEQVQVITIDEEHLGGTWSSEFSWRLRAYSCRETSIGMQYHSALGGWNGDDRRCFDQSFCPALAQTSQTGLPIITLAPHPSIPQVEFEMADSPKVQKESGTQKFRWWVSGETAEEDAIEALSPEGHRLAFGRFHAAHFTFSAKIDSKTPRSGDPKIFDRGTPICTIKHLWELCFRPR